MSNATRPWTVEKWADKQGGKGISIKDGDGLCIANMVGQLDDSEMKKARLIVLAVNCHAAILEVLKVTAENIRSLREAKVCNTYDNWLEVVEAAIAKAGG
jgi:hypothetical protein